MQNRLCKIDATPNFTIEKFPTPKHEVLRTINGMSQNHKVMTYTSYLNTHTNIMVHLHWRIRIRIQKPNGYIVLCRPFHIAWTQTRIATLYFCKGQESESVPESVSGNENEQLLIHHFVRYIWMVLVKKVKL